MKNILSAIMLAVLLISCGKEKDESSTASCSAKKVEIDESIAKVNHCDQDSDCGIEGIHPHYGCYIYHNKEEDISSVLQSIDSYSTSSCWDGRTTLTTLKCATVSETDLECVAKKCQHR